MPAKKGKKEAVKPEELENVEEAVGEPDLKKGKAKKAPAKGKGKKEEAPATQEDEDDQDNDEDSADAITPEPEEAAEEKPKKGGRPKKDATKSRTKAELKEDSDLGPRTLRTRKAKPASYDEEEPATKVAKTKGGKKSAKAKGIYCAVIHLVFHASCD